MNWKLFTLDEARALLPLLKEMLDEANKECDRREICYLAASQKYDLAETALAQCSTNDTSLLVQKREDFQNAIQELSQSENAYAACLRHWASELGATGVIVRDIRQGLIDFQAANGNCQYFLCWQSPEPDISFWHLQSDGFAGRKPLATLCEFY